MNRLWSTPPAFRLMLAALLVVIPGLLCSNAHANGVGGNVVISQVYGGGGTTYSHDYVELHNRGTTPVNLSGWTIQYTSATGSSWVGTVLNGSVAGGGYYLVREGFGGAATPLPTPNALGNIPIDATSGKVALVNGITLLSGPCPGGASIVDFVGYGSANCAEGTPMDPLSTTMAGLRKDSGCTDTDQNANDFEVSAPNPRNNATPPYYCPRTLSYLAGPHGSISGTTPQSVPYGGDGDPVTAVGEANYHFVKWSDDNTDNPRTDLDVIADLTVTASFAIDQHTLTYLHGDHGAISGSTPQTVDHGQDGTAVTAAPDPNYHFVKWSDDKTDNPRTDLAVTADITVTAEFAINQYTLTYDHDTHGTISGDALQSVDYGQDGTAVTAVPNTGYHFVKWTPDNSTDNPRTDTGVTGNISVTATFSIDQYALSVSVAPPASGSVAPGPGLFDLGTVLSLVPTPEPGYHFDHWTGDVNSGANPLPVTMNTSVTLTAHFVPNATASQMVISQFWGAGGDNVEGLKSDYVELYNRGNGPATVTGWTIQFAQATGTVWNSSSLFGTVLPGKYLLVQLYGAGGGTVDVNGDVTGAIDVNASEGKLALVTNGTLLSGACPVGGGIVDFVGYGGANCSEGGTPTGAINASTASFRGNSGCDETDHNNADFAGGAPAPRNSTHAAYFCTHWDDVDPAPVELSLALVGANPVRGHARFSVGLPSEGLVRLTISDVQGRRVASIANDYLPAGRHDLAWDGTGDAGPVRSGLYYLTLEAMGRRVVRSFVLMR